MGWWYLDNTASKSLESCHLFGALMWNSIPWVDSLSLPSPPFEKNRVCLPWGWWRKIDKRHWAALGENKTSTRIPLVSIRNVWSVESFSFLVILLWHPAVAVMWLNGLYYCSEKPTCIHGPWEKYTDKSLDFGTCTVVNMQIYICEPPLVLATIVPYSGFLKQMQNRFCSVSPENPGNQVKTGTPGKDQVSIILEYRQRSRSGEGEMDNVGIFG